MVGTAFPLNSLPTNLKGKRLLMPVNPAARATQPFLFEQAA